RLASGRVPGRWWPREAALSKGRCSRPWRRFKYRGKEGAQSRPGSGNMATKITRDIIESYLNCKYKGHLKLIWECGTPSDYEPMTTAAAQASRAEALAKLTARFGESNACRGMVITASALKQGKTLLVDADLEDEALSLRFDALKRVDGPSKVGDHH